MDFGSQFLRALHVIERQNVRVGAGRGLLKAAAGHAQNAVHAFDHLAERPGVEPDENLAGVGNGIRGEVEFVLNRVFQSSVEDHVLFAPVGNDFDLANHDVCALCVTIHASRKRQLELADAPGF